MKSFLSLALSHFRKVFLSLHDDDNDDDDDGDYDDA